ncbi:MAG: hypothetical protein QOH60_3666, partial [Mycobacterium sp.]|nr:hypothetical protein [Mycobacterium sp.]
TALTALREIAERIIARIDDPGTASTAT